MARTIDAALDLLQLSPHRSPMWKALIYDIRSSGDTMRNIVLGDILNEEPRDFTGDTMNVEIRESAGNFVDSGIPAASLTIQIADPNSQFDYFNLFGNPTGDGRWVRRDNVIRILEGDADIAEEFWPITFTGFLIGQAGINNNRTTGRAEITMEAVGRETRFVTSKHTSSTFGPATTYLGAAKTIAQEDMGLDIDETALIGWGAQTMSQTVTQFVDQEPMISLAQLMLADGFLPKFKGTGILGQVQGLTTAVPARVYFNDDIIESVVQPFSNENPVNQVCLIGLDAEMTKISQDRQEVGRIAMTVGFFSNDVAENFYWSTDRTSLADNIKFIIESSINGFKIFGSESFREINTPNGGEGTIGGTVTVGTGFAPYIVAIIAVAYIAAAWIPDLIEALGFVVNVGITVPIGRAVQAILLASALTIMQNIGRAVYRVDGTPFEWVFLEIRACAELDGLFSEDINSVTIENHLINTQALANTTAKAILFRQQARGRPRTIKMLRDLRLEPDDTIELSNARRYLIDQLTYKLERSNESVLMSVSAFEVTEGIGALV